MEKTILYKYGKMIIAILSLVISLFAFLSTFILFVKQQLYPNVMYFVMISLEYHLVNWLGLLVLIGLCAYFLIKQKSIIILFILSVVLGIISATVFDLVDYLFLVALLLYSFVFIKIPKLK